MFGSRFLDDLAPILFVAIAWGTSVGMLGSRFARTVFGLLAAWSFVLFQAAAFLYDKAWDTVPVNVNDDPSRLLNWSDPQWLAVLRLVPSADERVLLGAVLTALPAAGGQLLPGSGSAAEQRTAESAMPAHARPVVDLANVLDERDEQLKRLGRQMDLRRASEQQTGRRIEGRDE